MQENLYEQDICLWALQTAEILRSHRFCELDLEHLIDEVEDLSKRERDKLLSCLKVLLTHILKWKYQPELCCANWEITIKRCRNEIQSQLEDTPSLKQFLVSDKWIEKSYERACRDAADETSLSLCTFPKIMPFTIAQVLSDTFWPNFNNS